MVKEYKSSFYVYQLKNGSFFKYGNRGSFSLAQRAYTRKELSTGNLNNAATFNNVSADFIDDNVPPYASYCLMGGKWIKVSLTKTFTLEG